ncbi:variant erythrocyte surface antigen-1 family protein [Babesia caballi]|uniref:Variant erythrocyte surface antigen-1 family protein n=1 Tax=Babesia caballi TaxID=5871 RepID=A0AAV4LSX9_BABCB|nr:variant erythrocyte surface antigen-1 family protein [Babesia caballi]
MTSGQKSLTQPPESLKDAVDWVLCMSGNDGEGDYSKGPETIQALAEKLQNLLRTVRVDGVDSCKLLMDDAIGHGSGNNRPIESIYRGLKDLIDQQNGMGSDYKCSYSDSDPSKSIDEKSAKMFCGMVPLIFFGIGFLFYVCRRDGGGWSKRKLSVGPIKDFLETVGFSADQLNGQKDGYNAVSSGLAMFSEFGDVESTPRNFSNFLKDVVEQTKRSLNSNPNHVPLGALYLFTYQYLKTKNAEHVIHH